MRSRRARAVKLAALGASSAAVLALLGLWQRTALAEWAVVRVLNARGVPAELRVERLGLRGAEIADMKLGDASAPDLALARAELAWSWEAVRARRLDRIALRGLRLRARIDDEGAHFGALDALLERDEPTPDEPLTLPFLEAQLEDARATIDSQQGELELRADGNAAPEGHILRAKLTLHGESPRGAVDFGGGGTLDLATDEIAAAGALGGVTPWGRVEGLARVEGTLAVVRAEFSGSAHPDAGTLPVRVAEPLTLSGVATRSESGAFDASVELVAKGLEIEDLASFASVSGKGTLTSDASGIAADASFEASGARSTDVAAAGRMQGTAQLRGERIEASAELRDFELPDLARAANAKLRGSYDLASGALAAHFEAPRAIAPERANLEGVTLDVSLADGRLSGDLRAARVIESSQPALIAPLRIAGKLSGTLERIVLTGEAHTPGDGLVFALNGALLTERGDYELKIVLPETDVSPKARQPARVFPWLADLITAMRGKLGGEALASQVDDVLGASGVIALSGADIVTEWGTIRGLMGVVTATAIDPLETPPSQTIWMQSVDAGLPLGAGTLKFHLRKDGVLDVERGEWGLAQGKLLFSGAIPLDARERHLELRVENLSLEALLKALDFEGLAGTGLLGGNAPILQRGEELLVQGAELRANKTGVIRFQPGVSGEALGRKQPVLLPVLGALENLEYDELTLVMNGDLADRVDVKLHIRGRNPNYQSGRPVVLNVNVDLPLGSLMKAAGAATGVPDEIEEQVQRAMGKEKP